MDKSKVSRAAARLEEAGLVRKVGHAEDRRLVELSLTPAGETLMAELGEIARRFQDTLIAELGPDASVVDAALGRLIKSNSGENDDDHAP